MATKTNMSFPLSCRDVTIVLSWLGGGVIIGIFIALVVWCGDLLVNRQSIRQAILGGVEDAWGTLQALVVLGGLVGAGVGFVNGLRRVLSFCLVGRS